jgi:hypothetical protein
MEENDDDEDTYCIVYMHFVGVLKIWLLRCKVLMEGKAG